MWILKWIVLAILLVSVVAFSGQNAGEIIDLRFLLWEMRNIPLSIALFDAFVAGLAIWFLISASYTIQVRSELKKLREENRVLKEIVKKLKEDSGENYQGD